MLLRNSFKMLYIEIGRLTLGMVINLDALITAYWFYVLNQRDDENKMWLLQLI